MSWSYRCVLCVCCKVWKGGYNQLYLTYSDPKNWFTRGQILLVSQIMAQVTKLNPWNFVVTKLCISSFVMPKFRTLTLAHHLIYILQSSRFSESVFLLAYGLALFGPYHHPYPSGHALNQFSTKTLGTLSNPTFTYSKAHVHQQEGPHKHWPLPGVLPQIFNRPWQVAVQTTSRYWPCSVRTISRPSWGVFGVIIVMISHFSFIFILILIIPLHFAPFCSTLLHSVAKGKARWVRDSSHTRVWGANTKWGIRLPHCPVYIL